MYGSAVLQCEHSLHIRVRMHAPGCDNGENEMEIEKQYTRDGKFDLP